ncbi:hypothetical protein HZS_6993 [Henneguya salminicola]|nr:hypothetical protein HZS_6993 [Henneguya salminicola]
MGTLSSEDIIIHVAISHYFPFYYGINAKELMVESVGPIIESKRYIMHSFFESELSYADVKLILYICE